MWVIMIMSELPPLSFLDLFFFSFLAEAFLKRQGGFEFGAAAAVSVRRSSSFFFFFSLENVKHL